MLRKRYPVLVVASLAVSILYAVIVVRVSGSDILYGRNDFAPLWAAAKLVGTQDLYSFEGNQRIEWTVTGVPMKITYFRLPFYAVLLKPLLLLPYVAAYWL